jgi:hemerythrin superfamily protein
MASKRETVTPRGDRRFVRRDEQGQFRESAEAGRSLGVDIRQRARRTVEKGEGDRGDQQARGESGGRSSGRSGGRRTSSTRRGSGRGGSRARRSSSKRSGRTARSRRSRSTSRSRGTRSRKPRRKARSAGSRPELPGTGRATDATALLKADHERVARLFEQFEQAREPKRKQHVFREIKVALEVHTTLEEEIFYREADQHGQQKLQALLEEARGEHAKVKELIRGADGLDPESGEFDAGVAAIRGAVEHHVKEEEGEMFPQVRKTFSRDELRELGRRMEVRRSELRREAGPAKEKEGLLDKLAGLVGAKGEK